MQTFVFKNEKWQVHCTMWPLCPSPRWEACFVSTCHILLSVRDGQVPQSLMRHLRWIMQKDLLGQDVFLIGPPGPLRRSIAMMYLVRHCLLLWCTVVIYCLLLWCTSWSTVCWKGGCRASEGNRWGTLKKWWKIGATHCNTTTLTMPQHVEIPSPIQLSGHQPYVIKFLLKKRYWCQAIFPFHRWV